MYLLTVGLIFVNTLLIFSQVIVFDFYLSKIMSWSLPLNPLNIDHLNYSNNFFRFMCLYAMGIVLSKSLWRTFSWTEKVWLIIPLWSSTCCNVQCLPGQPIVTHIMADYELSLWQAFRQVLPQCKMSGCLFHFRQAIYRKHTATWTYKALSWWSSNEWDC